jgi:N-acetylneuraminic acid mutarotase
MALAGAGAAQAAWSGGDALATARYNHTATLLKDGRVLVTGGNNGGPLDSAELYDPAKSAWSNAAAMSFARHGDAAVLLHSGKVLVAGGFAPTADPASPASGYTRTAEIYDPAANTWTKAAAMSAGRFQPTMTVLDDGRVLVAGGSGDITTPDGVLAAVPLASAEIYDPATDGWTDVASMSVPRAMATATLLPGGKVLVAGGFDDASRELRSAELYDPASGQWSPTDSLAEARDSATATALPDGEVLVAGGDGGAGRALASAEVYKPGAGTWQVAASMTGARQTAAAALLEDGTVLVAGGENGRFGTLRDTAERYDPAADTWTDAGTMAVARTQHTLTALNDGDALVVGGNPGGFDGGLASAERFSTATTSPAPIPSGTPPDGGVPTGQTGGTGGSGGAAQPAGAAPTSDAAQPAGAAQTDGATQTAGAAPATGAAETSGAAPIIAAGQIPGLGQATGGGPTTGAPQTAAAGGGKQSAAGAVARASCTVKTTTRGHGRKRSTVTCRLAWPTSEAVALRARLMHGTTVLGSTRTTARAGQAALRLAPSGRLRPGRYAVVIARSDGTVVLRRQIRVS